MDWVHSEQRGGVIRRKPEISPPFRGIWVGVRLWPGFDRVPNENVRLNKPIGLAWAPRRQLLIPDRRQVVMPLPSAEGRLLIVHVHYDLHMKLTSNLLYAVGQSPTNLGARNVNNRISPLLLPLP